VLGKGYSPVDYALLCYGGGGPLHVAGYTAGVPYRDVLVPAWAAGFSAYGCACADFEYRFEQTVDMPIAPDAPAEAKTGGGQWLTSVWLTLRDRTIAEFAKSGVDAGDVRFRHLVRMQYRGQLNDLEIESPATHLDAADDLDALVDAFEAAYAKLYARSARSPELGYVITQAIVLGTTAVEKPELPDRDEAGSDPPAAASKGTRDVRWADGTATTEILTLDALRPGNVVTGPAIVEHSATTFAVPPGRSATLDRHLIFHLRAEEA
jgi:N-methylhydantoinase A/oxoprolinase/acetone carboxylase beta subunit